jgi:hypothetical protein
MLAGCTSPGTPGGRNQNESKYAKIFIRENATCKGGSQKRLARRLELDASSILVQEKEKEGSVKVS